MNSSQAHPHDPDSIPVSLYSWYVILVLFLMNLIAWIDRQIIVLLIDPIRLDLNITDVQIGLLTGFAFALLHAVFGFPLGLAADRLSRRIVIFWGVISWSLATVGCGLANSFWQLFAGRVGVGIGEAALSPAAYSIVADTFPPNRLAFANAVIGTGNSVGLGLSFVIGGLIAGIVDNGVGFSFPVIGEVRSWQIAFIGVGIPGFFAAFLLFTIKEPVRKGIAHRPTEQPDLPLRLVSYLKSHWKYYSCHLGGMGILAIGIYGMMTWGAIFLTRNFDWSAAKVGSAFGTVLTCGSITSLLLSGKVVDFFYSRGLKAAAPYIFSIAALLNILVAFVSVASSSPVAFLIGIFFWFTLSVGYAATNLAAIQSVTPNEFRGRLVSIYLFFATILGLGLGPLLVAMLTQYLFGDDRMVGWSLVIVIACVNPLAAALMWRAGTLMKSVGPSIQARPTSIGA